MNDGSRVGIGPIWRVDVGCCPFRVPETRNERAKKRKKEWSHTRTRMHARTFKHRFDRNRIDWRSHERASVHTCILDYSHTHLEIGHAREGKPMPKPSSRWELWCGRSGPPFPSPPWIPALHGRLHSAIYLDGWVGVNFLLLSQYVQPGLHLSFNAKGTEVRLRTKLRVFYYLIELIPLWIS